MPTGIPTKTKRCIICGQEFLPKTPSNRICNEDHYNFCPICGEKIIWNSTRKVEPCSKQCRLELARIHSREKYGTDHPMQNKVVQQHHKESMMKTHGVEFALQSQELKEKAIETNLHRYGVEWVQQNEEIRKKSEETMKTRYGGKTTLESDILKQKMHATMIARYGEPSLTKVERFRKTIQETNFHPYEVPYSCMADECKELQESIILAINRKFGEILEDHNIEYSYKKRMDSKSFDIFVPSSNVVIEIDPTYTHNVIGDHWGNKLDERYHLEKTMLAENDGHRCIHVFDWDDWNPIIQLLKPRKSIYARNCEVWRINKDAGDKFLNSYHIQKSCRGQLLYLGLVYQDELLQVMTFGRSRFNKHYDVELLRLCTKPGIQLVGGSSKLFSYATSEYGLNNIISYCDYSKFTGTVYEKMGMKFDHQTPPQEIWSKGTQKITANLLRQHGYDQLFNTSYGKGTSNDKLMLENGWLPVYDCGQKVYVF